MDGFDGAGVAMSSFGVAGSGGGVAMIALGLGLRHGCWGGGGSSSGVTVLCKRKFTAPCGGGVANKLRAPTLQVAGDAVAVVPLQLASPALHPEVKRQALGSGMVHRNAAPFGRGISA
jgi:hypothetical protein